MLSMPRYDTITTCVAIQYPPTPGSPGAIGCGSKLWAPPSPPRWPSTDPALSKLIHHYAGLSTLIQAYPHIPDSVLPPCPRPPRAPKCVAHALQSQPRVCGVQAWWPSGHLGTSLGPLKAIFGLLGAILGHLGAILESRCTGKTKI